MILQFEELPQILRNTSKLIQFDNDFSIWRFAANFKKCLKIWTKMVQNMNWNGSKFGLKWFQIWTKMVPDLN